MPIASVETQEFRRRRLPTGWRSRIAFAVALGLWGCALDVEPAPEQQPAVAHQQHAVLNGWNVGSTFKGVVQLWVYSSHFRAWLGACSGTVIRNNMVLTARHCIDGESTYSWGEPIRDYTDVPSALWVKMGSDWVQAREVYAYPDPDVDVALVLLEDGLPMYVNGSLSTSGYMRDFYQGTGADLDGRDVICMGYGPSSNDASPLDPEPLKSGLWTAEYSQVDGRDWLITPKNAWNQVGSGGDSGGPCFDRLGGTAPVVGVTAATGNVRTIHTLTTQFRDWMILGLFYTAGL